MSKPGSNFHRHCVPWNLKQIVGAAWVILQQTVANYPSKYFRSTLANLQAPGICMGRIHIHKSC